MAQILHCCGCDIGCSCSSNSDPSLGTSRDLKEKRKRKLEDLQGKETRIKTTFEKPQRSSIATSKLKIRKLSKAAVLVFFLLLHNQLPKTWYPKKKKNLFMIPQVCSQKSSCSLAGSSAHCLIRLKLRCQPGYNSHLRPWALPPAYSFGRIHFLAAIGLKPLLSQQLSTGNRSQLLGATMLSGPLLPYKVTSVGRGGYL